MGGLNLAKPYYPVEGFLYDFKSFSMSKNWNEIANSNWGDLKDEIIKKIRDDNNEKAKIKHLKSIGQNKKETVRKYVNSFEAYMEPIKDIRSMNHEEVESIIKKVLMKMKKSKDKNRDIKEDKNNDIKVVGADVHFIVLAERLVDIEQDHLQIEIMNIDRLFDVRALKRKLRMSFVVSQVLEDWIRKTNKEADEYEMNKGEKEEDVEDVMPIRRVEVETRQKNQVSVPNIYNNLLKINKVLPNTDDFENFS
ncbi:13110_t:CDS:2 [Gigaspora rosea]|nr:13110_t:CDS:2 [Gigaspora rosea]